MAFQLRPIELVRWLGKGIMDATHAARAGIYLEHLAGVKGKRVAVDMAASACVALEGLLASGWTAAGELVEKA